MADSPSSARRDAIKALKPFARLAASLAGTTDPYLKKPGVHVLEIGDASITVDDLDRAAATLAKLEKEK